MLCRSVCLHVSVCLLQNVKPNLVNYNNNTVARNNRIHHLSLLNQKHRTVRRMGGRGGGVGLRGVATPFLEVSEVAVTPRVYRFLITKIIACRCLRTCTPPPTPSPLWVVDRRSAPENAVLIAF